MRKVYFNLQGESKYVPHIKNYLKAYASNEHFRNEIKKQTISTMEFAGFTMAEFKQPNGFRETVPTYVKDYIPVNVYMR